MKDEENHWLARSFDERRSQLRAIAYRMLGSSGEADDAVQEAWLKLSRSDAAAVDNLGGWLTTVVARICLDMLRSRRSRREEPLPPSLDGILAGEGRAVMGHPETEVGLADAMGPALLVVLDHLAPPERIAFVLHDMFDVSFEEIAPIVERTPAAARQLASRARRFLRGGPAPTSDVSQHQELVSAFLAASRDGDFDRLVAALAPDVVLRADALAVKTAAANARRGGPELAPEVRGATTVANAFKGRARGASPALIEGEPGAVWAIAGRVRAAFVFTIESGLISGIDLMMNPEHLAELAIAPR